MRTRVQTKRLVALILGVVLVVVLAAGFAFGDIGDPSIPDDAVAVVEEAPDGEITQEEYELGLEQAAFNLNLEEVPAEDAPEYEQVRQSALANLIQTRWVRGEAAERGIEVTDRDTEQALEQIIEQQLGGQRAYERFLEDSPFDEAAVREVAELSAISDRLQAEALPAEPPPVEGSLVEDFYEANRQQFEQPASRDVRQVAARQEEDAQAALDALEEDDSEQSWEDVAEEFSADRATSAQGGLREGVVEGQSDPTIDPLIFSAPVGELQGPVEGSDGRFYVFQVVDETAAQTTPLDDVRAQIEQTLQQGGQTQAAERFRSDFINKWRSRTYCAEGFVVELCANAPAAPDACPIDDDSEREQADPESLQQGCEAFVLPRPVINPGAGSVFPGSQVPALPQGPVKPAAAEPELPPGLPVGPGGAPPGGAPPGGGAVPPQGG